MKTKKGFTLIELLVVIAIIGILSAIGITAFSGAQGKARDSKRKADLGALASNLTLWLDSNTAYPLQAAVSEVKNSATLTSTAANGFATKYSVPTAPNRSATLATTTVNDYWYITDAAGTMFGLFTKLESATDRGFVTNSKGFSDEVADTHTAVPVGTNTECANTATGGAFVYSVCLAQPVL